MKVLILNTDYPAFVNQFYRSQPQLAGYAYQEQWNIRSQSLFGVADYYSRAFKQLGHEATEVYGNLRPMLRAWSQEQGSPWSFIDRWQDRFKCWCKRFTAERKMVHRLVSERIRIERPDLLLNQDMHIFDAEFFRALRNFIGCLVGQHACTEVWRDNPQHWKAFIPEPQDWTVYNLIISSMPASVQWFAQRGANATLNRLGVDPETMRGIHGAQGGDGISFIGSLTDIHSSRRDFLRDVATSESIKLWVPPQDVVKDMALKRHNRGELYGRQMLKQLKASDITLNHHGNVREHANNLRIYEATGVGTLLLTDWKPDLEQIFQPNREILAYRHAGECIELIRKFSVDKVAGRTIAECGRQRVLSEHSYANRMRELLRICQCL